MSRRQARRISLAALGVVVTVVTPSAGRAQSTVTSDAYQESPQRFALEFRFAPYGPMIDEDEGMTTTECGGGPYVSTFGGNKLMTEVEFDYQFPLDIVVGTLGVGAVLGIFHATGQAFAQGECTRSEDETGLWIMPMTLLGVVRFDIFADRWYVPLVPFFKFGFSYALWWATNESGVSEVDGVKGYGGTFGLRVGGGAMLRLDWIERRASRTMDNEFGINHSYIIFEYYYAWLDDFGREEPGDEPMNLSDHTWVLGMALEF